MRSLIKTVAISLLFLAGALGITLGLAYVLPAIPTADIPVIGRLLLIIGSVVGVLAILLVRTMMLGHFGGVRVQIVGAGLIGSFLLVGMVVAGARAMFLSGHDRSLLLTMLLFAALLVVGVSLYGAALMGRRIERVRAGTARLAGGELDTEVSVEGHDEIAGLAEDFNRMSLALQEAKSREKEMEEARRDLIAAVAHDLRTPLASTRALIEAVTDGVASDPELRARYLNSAQGEISHLSQLVEDLFELARIDAGVLQLNLERASLHDLISDTLSSFQGQAREQGVRLVGEVSSDVDPVLMNPPKLQRVFHNLISNALHHTPTDGTIALRAEPNGKVVRVEVADTGRGISAEDLPRVFERSFRGEQSRTRPLLDGASGAGLGLAIARGLIEAHGGVIDVESQPGQGSCFRFTLRRA
ncbi:MAG: sensor histidine kinase [Rubrobacteraceae bacterium]